MSNDILGSLLRALVAVPEDRLGLVKNFARMLGSREGDIWEQEAKLFLRKESCWVEPVFGKIETVAPVNKWEHLGWDDFLYRSDRLAKELGKKLVDQKAIKFYEIPENWHLLPAPETGITCVVFAKGDGHGVSALWRDGSRWYKGDPRLRNLCFFTEAQHTAVS